jgi:LysM repeat protein
MRNFASIALAATIFLFCIPSVAEANPSAALMINGQRIAGEASLIRNDRAYVPLRLVSESLNAKVQWNQSRRTIDISNGHSEIRLFLNKAFGYMNARRIGLDAPPFLVGSTTYVPLRFVATALGADVHYDNRSVSIRLAGAKPPASASGTATEYRVSSGDTLGTIAARFKTSVAAIKQTNQLKSDLITPGQLLFVPTNSKQPVTNISVPSRGSKTGYGELIEWQYANWIFNHHSTAVIHDLWSGKRFNIYRIGGANHADCEPLTAQDTAIMKSIYGGQWSWNTRPVIVEIDGRRLAASMNGMPHAFNTVPNNNFNGMFCVHFWKSRNHNTNAENPAHQLNVQRAAGLK